MEANEEAIFFVIYEREKKDYLRDFLQNHYKIKLTERESSRFDNDLRNPISRSCNEIFCQFSERDDQQHPLLALSCDFFRNVSVNMDKRLALIERHY